MLLYLKVELFYNGAFNYYGKSLHQYLIWWKYFDFFVFWGAHVNIFGQGHSYWALEFKLFVLTIFLSLINILLL